MRNFSTVEPGGETGHGRMAGDGIGARRVSGTGRGRQAGDGGAGGYGKFHFQDQTW